MRHPINSGSIPVNPFKQVTPPRRVIEAQMPRLQLANNLFHLGFPTRSGHLDDFKVIQWGEEGIDFKVWPRVPVCRVGNDARDHTAFGTHRIVLNTFKHHIALQLWSGRVEMIERGDEHRMSRILAFRCPGNRIIKAQLIKMNAFWSSPYRKAESNGVK